MTEPAVAKEQAELEFDEFANAWDIETSTDEMDEESRDDFEKIRAKFIKLIMSGRLSMDEKKQLTYTLANPPKDRDVSSLTFRVPKGSDYLAMDSYKDKQSARKMFAFIASMSGTDVRLIGDLEGADIKFCQNLTTLFMVS